MFGAFRPTSALSGGLLWKIPWRLSRPQKARQRKRLRMVDNVIAVVDNALAKQGTSAKAVERWKEEMPREEEMVPRDKYTMFDRKEKRYRKGVHKLPKWTRVSQRVNPPGF
ncbi:MAG: mitochondrial 54s ribosomal 31 [Lasallia pustulata]|uniref:Large ribosomal subunit protein mL60 n=1 Tax=Lasallia pustulata TaxID=136370 RepID=A0A1W5D865_9LECA|nr:MAG: mitochondrial 54s ribosomal 31 [Lasallia pustulata]SLM39314.1 mitochondrial 54s ribosomal protein 31 [Lasallia pustulata]